MQFNVLREHQITYAHMQTSIELPSFDNTIGYIAIATNSGVTGLKPAAGFNGQLPEIFIVMNFGEWYGVGFHTWESQF